VDHGITSVQAPQILKPELVNLNRIVADTEKMLHRLIGEHMLDSRPAGNLGAVQVDPGQTEQVIINPAVNARDAMPMGECLTIETRNVELDSDYVDRRPGVQRGSYVMLAVSDTGMEQGVRQTRGLISWRSPSRSWNSPERSAKCWWTAEEETMDWCRVFMDAFDPASTILAEGRNCWKKRWKRKGTPNGDPPLKRSATG